MEDRTYRNEKTEDDNVLYPFGYGLSYGDVKVIDAKAEVSGDIVKAAVTLENSGMETADVLEAYFKSESKDAVRNHALCGFKKVRFAENEKKVVEIEIPIKALTVVSDEGVRYLDKDAKTTLYFGTSQPDTLSAELTGKTCIALDIKL